MASVSQIVRVSVALAAVAASGAALAANTTVVYTPPTIATDHWLPTSGSTALDNAIKEYFMLSGGICQATTAAQALVGSYTVNGGTSTNASGPVVLVDGATTGSISAHYTTEICESNAAFGTIKVGDVIAVAKESSGGSLEGTIYPATNTSLSFIDPFATANGTITCTTTGATVGAYPSNANELAGTLINGCSTSVSAGNNANYIPVAGWADEAPQAWFGFGARPITQAQVNNLNSAGLVQNVFGIVVSLNLYRTLQNMQGLANGDDLATMPSLSSSVITGLLTGNVTPWTAITDSAGLAVNNAKYYKNAAALKDTNVWVCKRGTSSGTSAWADIAFDGQRCSNSSLGLLPATTTATNCSGLPGGGITPNDWGCTYAAANLTDSVFPGAGTGDVTSCITAHDTNNQFAIGYATTNALFGDPLGAGGSGDTGANKFRFVAIDGRLPNLTGVANGTYPFVQDDVFNTAKTSTSPAKANISGFNTYVTSSTTGFGNVKIIRDFINASQQTNAVTTGSVQDKDWTAGLLFDNLETFGNTASATPITSADLTTAAGTPVSTYTQQLSGSINNCAVPAAELNVQNVPNP
jgi:hypothetical protein